MSSERYVLQVEALDDEGKMEGRRFLILDPSQPDTTAVSITHDLSIATRFTSYTSLMKIRRFMMAERYVTGKQGLVYIHAAILLVNNMDKSRPISQTQVENVLEAIQEYSQSQQMH